MNRSNHLLAVVLIVAAASYAQIERESVGSNGAQGTAGSHEVAVSADGRFVAFASEAANIVPGTTVGQIYLRDRQLNQTTVVSKSTSGAYADSLSCHPSISADGRFVAFASGATNLDGSLSSSLAVFVHDRATATTQRVSVSTAGVVGNFYSDQPAISGDGRYIAFRSRGGNLLDGVSVPVSVDRVYVRDLQMSTTSIVSVDAAGAPTSGFWPAISGDGRYVTFTSVSPTIFPNDGNGAADIFLRDLVTGASEIVSVTPGGTTGSNTSFRSSISADGRYVAFNSRATNLISFTTLNGIQHTLVRDRLTQTTELVSVGPAGAEGIGADDWPTISADGLHVAFGSTDPTLVPGDTNVLIDVFVRDLLPGVTRRISLGMTGAQGDHESPSSGQNGMGPTFAPVRRVAISGDGRYVAFESLASTLVPTDTNAVEDIFLVDRGCDVQFGAFGQGLAGTGGATPFLLGFGGSCTGSAAIVIAGGLGGAPATIVVGPARVATPLAVLGGLVYLDVSQPLLAVPVMLLGVPGFPGGGSLVMTGIDLSGLATQTLYLQVFIVDPAAPAGVSMTNAMSLSII